MKTPKRKIRTAKIPASVAREHPNPTPPPKAPILMKKDCLYWRTAKPLDEDVKISPQAMSILTLAEKPIRREDLDKAVKEANPHSVQEGKKMVSFYQSGLRKLGLLDYQNPHR